MNNSILFNQSILVATLHAGSLSPTTASQSANIEAVKDGCLEQKSLDGGQLVCQNLVHQIVR